MAGNTWLAHGGSIGLSAAKPSQHCRRMMGIAELSSGAHSRDPLAQPILQKRKLVITSRAWPTGPAATIAARQRSGPSGLR